jgi:hypothetical protein
MTPLSSCVHCEETIAKIGKRWLHSSTYETRCRAETNAEPNPDHDGVVLPATTPTPEVDAYEVTSYATDEYKQLGEIVDYTAQAKRKLKTNASDPTLIARGLDDALDAAHELATILRQRLTR